MNNAHTMSPADMSAAPTKVIQLIALFLNFKHLFILHLCWPSASQNGMLAHGEGRNIFIITK